MITTKHAVLAAVIPLVLGGLSACGGRHDVKTAAVEVPRLQAQKKAPEAQRPPAPLPPAPPAYREAAAAQASAQTEPPKLVRFYGIVGALEQRGSELLVKDLHGKTHTFTIAPAPVLTMGGNYKAVTLSRLKPGEHVRLMVSGNEAYKIHISVFKKTGKRSAAAGKAKATT
jgi:hypothetical protein